MICDSQYTAQPRKLRHSGKSNEQLHVWSFALDSGDGCLLTARAALSREEGSCDNARGCTSTCVIRSSEAELRTCQLRWRRRCIQRKLAAASTAKHRAASAQRSYARQLQWQQRVNAPLLLVPLARVETLPPVRLSALAAVTQGAVGFRLLRVAWEGGHVGWGAPAARVSGWPSAFATAARGGGAYPGLRLATCRAREHT